MCTQMLHWVMPAPLQAAWCGWTGRNVLVYQPASFAPFAMTPILRLLAAFAMALAGLGICPPGLPDTTSGDEMRREF